MAIHISASVLPEATCLFCGSENLGAEESKEYKLQMMGKNTVRKTINTRPCKSRSCIGRKVGIVTSRSPEDQISVMHGLNDQLIRHIWKCHKRGMNVGAIVERLKMFGAKRANEDGTHSNIGEIEITNICARLTEWTNVPAKAAVYEDEVAVMV